MRTLFADLRRWIGVRLQRLYPVDLSVDALTSIQHAAIERNRVASEENRVAAENAAAAINDLLATMEAKRNGQN